MLRVRGLRIAFRGVRMVDGIDLDLDRGRILCVVGESGSGKTLTALSLLRLLPAAAEVTLDRFELEGEDLARAPRGRLEALRGDRLAMIFQEPATALNPVMTVGRQIVEPLVAHRGLAWAPARALALDMLARVQIPAPEARFDAYPHQLSGGMRQRVMIAMALVCRPAVLVADEPTTALDVTVQSQILALVDRLRAEFGTAVLLITHNLAVVAEVADDVAVMYAGRVVERASRDRLFGEPQHPYTISLLAAMPRAGQRGEPLAAIEGQVPAPGAMPAGCRFAPRCPFALPRCDFEDQALREISLGHEAACWRAPLDAAT